MPPRSPNRNIYTETAMSAASESEQFRGALMWDPRWTLPFRVHALSGGYTQAYTKTNTHVSTHEGTHKYGLTNTPDTNTHTHTHTFIAQTSLHSTWHGPSGYKRRTIPSYRSTFSCTQCDRAASRGCEANPTTPPPCNSNAELRAQGRKASNRNPHA